MIIWKLRSLTLAIFLAAPGVVGAQTEAGNSTFLLNTSNNAIRLGPRNPPNPFFGTVKFGPQNQGVQVFGTQRFNSRNLIDQSLTSKLFKYNYLNEPDYTGPLQGFIDPAYCPPYGNITPFMKLANEMAPQCFAGKVPVESNKLDHHALLKYEYRICKCLRNPKNQILKKEMDSNEFKFSEPKLSLDALSNFKHNLENLKKNISNDRDGLTFQALTIGEDSTKGKLLSELYSTEARLNIGKVDMAAKAKDAVENAQLVNGVDKKLTSGQIEFITNEVTNFKIPPRKESNLFKDAPLDEKNGQCISGRDFLAIKQQPTAEVLKELQKINSENFNPRDWSYVELREKFDQLIGKDVEYKLAHKKELSNLKEKIRFLDRNPMVKAFLAADDSLSYIDKLPEEMRAEFQKNKAENQKKLRENKIELLNTLKLSVVDTDKYKKKMGEFFADEKVLGVVDIVSEKLINQKVARLSDLMSFHNTKDFIFTKDAVISSFVKETGLKSPDTCGMDGLNNQCLPIYSAYCRKLDKVIPFIPNISGESFLYDDLDSMAEHDFNPDFKTNPELQEFNKNVCEPFKQFIAQTCSNSPKIDCAGPSNHKSLFSKFLKTPPKTLNPKIAKDMQQAAIRFSGDANIPTISSESVNKWQGNVEGRYQHAKELSKSWGGSESKFLSDMNGVNPSESLNSLSQVANGFDGTEKLTNSNVIDNSTYSNGLGPSKNAVQDEKIEDLSDEKRRDLLDDWKKEYSDLQNKKTAENSSVSAEESAMKARIEALEQLLAQQKKLTDDQYKLLNQSLASQNKAKQESIANFADGSDGPDNTKSKRERDSSNEPSRSFASIPDASPVSRSASPGFSSSSSSSGSKGSISNAAKSASMANEALLAKYRNNADGSITIESVGSSASQNANAITLSVSDEQYKILQSDPVGLNLSQLEAKIPKDQIAKLEKNGLIIIFLKNGNNPLYEVKVEKKDNKLVYQVKDEKGKDQMPVRRVTLRALAGELKANQ